MESSYANLLRPVSPRKSFNKFSTNFVRLAVAWLLPHPRSFTQALLRIYLHRILLLILNRLSLPLQPNLLMLNLQGISTQPITNRSPSPPMCLRSPLGQPPSINLPVPRELYLTFSMFLSRPVLFRPPPPHQALVIRPRRTKFNQLTWRGNHRERTGSRSSLRTSN